MPTVAWPSLADAEVIDVEFVTKKGVFERRLLLVDSGFIGESSIVLGLDSGELVTAKLEAVQTSGALQGSQNRGWVSCRIPALNFQRAFIAIVTDTQPLTLPERVQGMVGLSFLRQFARWGTERTEHGWRFSLVSD